MPYNGTLIIWLVVWLAIAGTTLYLQARRTNHRVGLVLAYIFGLWLIHWLGPSTYIWAWDSYFDPDDVMEGLKQSTYAVAAFGVGVVLLGPVARKVFVFPPPVTAYRYPALRLAPLYIISGLAFYMVLSPLLVGPSISAVVASGGNLITAGLVLKSWWAWKENKHAEFIRAMLMALALPFLTLITQGFIGYGTFALILVCACVASLYRPSWKVVIIGVLACYLGLSIYVTYTRDKTAVREVIWGGESYLNRFDRLYQTFSEFELFNPNDLSHLERIDLRLNQSALVGVAVRNMETSHVEFANGDTIVDAALALVPRVIWPSKPVSAGSGDMVNTYTGIVFAEGTSVGVGQVMEFYINFGVWGILMGFLVMGALVGLIDEAAGERMFAGEWSSFILWFLPGITFLQVGGQLVEVTSSAAAALILAIIFKRFVFGRPRAIDTVRPAQLPLTRPSVSYGETGTGPSAR